MDKDCASPGLREEITEECYQEFISNMRIYVEARPAEGLVVASYNNLRLYKDGEQFVVRHP